jgi:hypothetical protein
MPRKGHRKGNKIVIEGDIAKVYLTNSEDYFLIDAADVEQIKKLTWAKTGCGYASGHLPNTKHILAHVYLLGKKEGCEIDHINRNKLDNRRCNLRHVSHSSNMHNVDYAPRKRKNLAMGVEVKHYKSATKYIAYISIDHKKIHLGSFFTLEEAVKARKEAEVFYWGEQVTA